MKVGWRDGLRHLRLSRARSTNSLLETALVIPAFAASGTYFTQRRFKSVVTFEAVHADLFVVSKVCESHRTVKTIPCRHFVLFWHKYIDAHKSNLSHRFAKGVERNLLKRPSYNGLIDAMTRRFGLMLFHEIASLHARALLQRLTPKNSDRPLIEATAAAGTPRENYIFM